MPSQRYERIPDGEREESSALHPVPNSPPPSFRSRASSPAHTPTRRSGTSDVDPTLEDTFNVPSDDEDDDRGDDRQRLMHSDAISGARRPGQSDAYRVPAGSGTRRFVPSNDGVFANLSAKPERGEKAEEQPPSYEQAAADATPPYWETTILAPGMVSDEVFIDGLPVGSVFSFAWNGIISMAFQLVGFLLTYLLHTTHAAKNGSRAGLGVTLISWGFQMKASMDRENGGGGGRGGYSTPSQPNSHDFDPAQLAESVADVSRRSFTSSLSSLFSRTAGGGAAPGAGAPADYDGSWMASGLAYAVMVIGWLILLKAVMDFVKARRHEQLILQSPDRGLGVPIVGEAEGEGAV